MDAISLNMSTANDASITVYDLIRTENFIILSKQKILYSYQNRKFYNFTKAENFIILSKQKFL